MRRVGILVLTCLLLVTGMTAAFAYNTATVTNAGQITVNNTSEALLALVPSTGDGNRDLTAAVSDGNLVFSFGRGIPPYFAGDHNYGLQKNSVYIWGGPDAINPLGLFTVQNRSAETIKVEMKVKDLPSGVKMYFAGRTYSGDLSDWVNVTDGSFHLIPVSYWTQNYGTGCSSQVSVKIVVDDTASFSPTTTSISVMVKATAQ